MGADARIDLLQLMINSTTNEPIDVSLQFFRFSTVIIVFFLVGQC